MRRATTKLAVMSQKSRPLILRVRMKSQETFFQNTIGLTSCPSLTGCTPRSCRNRAGTTTRTYHHYLSLCRWSNGNFSFAFFKNTNKGYSLTFVSSKTVLISILYIQAWTSRAFVAVFADRRRSNRTLGPLIKPITH